MQTLLNSGGKVTAINFELNEKEVTVVILSTLCIDAKRKSQCNLTLILFFPNIA
jgi:hypothetical protein